MTPTELSTLTPLMLEYLNNHKLIIESAPVHMSYSSAVINRNKTNKIQKMYYIESFFKNTTSYNEDFLFSFINFIAKKVDDSLLIKFIKFKAPPFTANDSKKFEMRIIKFLAKTKKREVTFSYIQQKKLLTSHIDLIGNLFTTIQINHLEQRQLFNTISNLKVFSTQKYQNTVYSIVKEYFRNPEQYNKNFIYIDTNLQEITSSQEHFSASLLIDKKKINAIIINSNLTNVELRTPEIIITKIFDF